MVWFSTEEQGMNKEDTEKRCAEYCPFLVANGTYCELFHCSLQKRFDNALKCEACKNPEQRMESYKSLDLSLDSRIEIWQKAVARHNEIELGKKRQEEEVRRKFTAFLEDKYGSRPPLEGNAYLTSLVVNLYMVLDMTERQMMMALLNGRNGQELLKTIDRAPKDENLLRNFRRELDSQYMDYQRGMETAQRQNSNSYSK